MAIEYHMKSRDRLGQKAIAAMQLADRPGGATTLELQKALGLASLTMTGSELSKKVRAGYLFSVKRWRNTRFFSTPEAAALWASQNAPTETDKRTAWSIHLGGTVPAHMHRKAATVAPVVVAPRKLATSAEIRPAAKITICPSPKFDSRFQVDPDVQHAGAGFSAVGIGRDVATGKPWGKS